MPKRKRSSKRYYSRYSKRRRYGPSPSSTAKALARLTQKTGPFGVDGSPTMTMYGPSRKQMEDNPGWARTAEQTQARLRDNYRGPGGYWQDFGRNLGHWGTRIGGAALGALGGLPEGGLVGATAGGVSGWNTGADISKALGWGSVRITNDLIDGGNHSTAPIYHSMGNNDEAGDVVISNRELVKLVKSHPTEAGKFHYETFTLNPLDETFHHLKEQAKMYEQFEFLGMIFEYVPMTGEGGSNELGVVGMAQSYDPAHTREFGTMDDFMRFKGSVTCKPSKYLASAIECDPNRRPVKVMYTRDSISRDASFTDPAVFYFGSEGTQSANQTLGQLWVTYSVRLRNIKLSSEVEALDNNYSAFAYERDIGTIAGQYNLNGSNVGDTWLALSENETLGMISKNELKSVAQVANIANGSGYQLTFDKNKVSVGDVLKVEAEFWLSCSGSFEASSYLSTPYPVSSLSGCSLLNTNQIIGDNEQLLSQSAEGYRGYLYSSGSPATIKAKCEISAHVVINAVTADPTLKIAFTGSGHVDTGAQSVKCGIKFRVFKLHGIDSNSNV